MTQLFRYDAACRAVAEAHSVDEVKSVRDKAIAMKEYARQAKNKQLEIEASEIRFRAERRLGEMMLEQPKATGTRGQLKGRDASGGFIRNPPEEIRVSLEKAGIDKNLAQRARQYAALPQAKFENILAERRERIELENKPVNAQLTLQSATNEHYTPSRYIEAARAVFGGIDLDPASCDAAQRVVQAANYYTIADDGLKQSWAGRIWLNPPYGGLVGGFVAKFMTEYEAGNVKSGIVLVSGLAPVARWFQPLWRGTLCFTDHRISFYGPGDRSQATHGSIFVYFGPKEDAFTEVFAGFGAIVVEKARKGAIENNKEDEAQYDDR